MLRKLMLRQENGFLIKNVYFQENPWTPSLTLFFQKVTLPCKYLENIKNSYIVKHPSQLTFTFSKSTIETLEKGLVTLNIFHTFC